MEIFHRGMISIWRTTIALTLRIYWRKRWLIVKRRKFLADFDVQDKETDLRSISMLSLMKKKSPTTPSNVEPFTYPAQDLTPPTLCKGLDKKTCLLFGFMHHELRRLRPTR